MLVVKIRVDLRQIGKLDQNYDESVSFILGEKSLVFIFHPAV